MCEFSSVQLKVQGFSLEGTLVVGMRRSLRTNAYSGAEIELESEKTMPAQGHHLKSPVHGGCRKDSCPEFEFHVNYSTCTVLVAHAGSGQRNSHIVHSSQLYYLPYTDGEPGTRRKRRVSRVHECSGFQVPKQQRVGSRQPPVTPGTTVLSPMKQPYWMWMQRTSHHRQ